MKKIITGNKIKIVLALVIFMVLIIPLSVLYNQTLLADWQPPESMVGKWTGKSELIGLNETEQATDKSQNQWIRFEITIKPDGNVSGKIGSSELVGLRVEQNRNWIERLINVKQITLFVVEI